MTATPNINVGALLSAFRVTNAVQNELPSATNSSLQSFLLGPTDTVTQGSTGEPDGPNVGQPFGTDPLNGAHFITGQRRPADDEGYEQDIFQQRMATRRTYNQIATLTRQKAQKAGLNATQVADIMEFINLSPADMLIDLKMHLHHIENDILHCLLWIFVRHPDTNMRARHTIATAILEPTIPAYLEGVTTQITAHIEQNLEALIGLPASCRNDPADWALVKSMIAIELANICSTMKSKLELAVKNKLDIYELTSSLMMYDLRPKKEHWGRFAFLRRCYERFKEARRTDKKSDLWKFMDQCLCEVRQEVMTTYPDSAVSCCLFTNMFFVQVLDANLKAYPIHSGALAHIPYMNHALTELQCNLETVATNFVVNDTAPAPGGDADDDEAGEGDGAIPEQ